ncbi:hypothetical protein LEP1GSC116_4825 [Leptospira interrogans serovar Icterohaemorrhagiae str. Verdun HP]|uniref:Uncharacterized protein n=1 Tax=Leptospira interrogans serovar Icterohaemorrhagiae str. Verdun HP TaxID=1049910 RepID=M6RAD0_LEPIR|nr:hypothetical protein LEP1GSC116_4825 [Leptospira interrogans serovar Icterohaemorrhagiae str. Verdun HP]
MLVRKFLEENKIIIGKDKNGNQSTKKSIFVLIPKKEFFTKEDGTKVYFLVELQVQYLQMKNKNLRISFGFGDLKSEETVKKHFQSRLIFPPEILNF